MTKNEILTIIYDDKHYNKTLKNICPSENYREDLKQEVFIILMNMDDELIIRLYNENNLIKYYNKIIYNNYKSKSSPFYTKYKKTKDRIFQEITYEDFNFDILIEDENFIEKTFDINTFDINQYIKEKKILNWSETELFLYYYEISNDSFLEELITENKTYKSIAKALGMSYAYVSLEFNKIRYKILHSMSKDMYKDYIDYDYFNKLKLTLKK